MKHISPPAWCLAVGDPVDLSLEIQFSPPFMHLEYSNLLVGCIQGRCSNSYLKTNFATRGKGGRGGVVFIVKAVCAPGVDLSLMISKYMCLKFLNKFS